MDSSTSTIPNPRNPNSTIVRGPDGKFIKSATPKVSLRISGPATVTLPGATTPDEPLLVINNPLRKLLRYLDYLRKHQSTTIALRLTIPLIALPVFVLAGYKLGKSQSLTPLPTTPTIPTPVPYTLSKVGQLRIIYTPTSTANPSGRRYTLIDRTGTVTTLSVNPTLDLTKFTGKRLLVSGIFNPVSQILTVDSLSNFELLPPVTPTLTPLPSPTSTPSPSPTPTLVPTDTPTPAPPSDPANPD